MKTFILTITTSLLVAAAAAFNSTQSVLASAQPVAVLVQQIERTDRAALGEQAFLTEFGDTWVRNAQGVASFGDSQPHVAIPTNALATITLECASSALRTTAPKVIAGQGIGATPLAALLNAKSHVLSALGGLSGVKCTWCAIPGACGLSITTLDPGWTIVSESVSDDGKTFYAMVSYSGDYVADCSPCK